MNKFEYVEEYVEVLAGYRDPVTLKVDPNVTWLWSFDPIISLARYDVSVLTSMTDQIITKQALTERQGELLVKIILKYQRQFAAKGIDVSPIESGPVWRVPLRKMDYSKRLSIENDSIIVRFPFNNQLIDSIKGFVKLSQGNAKWDKDCKFWRIALTEFNLSWLVAWAEVNQFEIDSNVTVLMNKILEAEKTDFAIELCINNEGLYIRNAERSLIDYIENNLGGFGADNALKLADMAPVLGYSIEKDLASAITSAYGHRFYNLVSNRELKINPSTLLTTDDFESVIEYAEKSDRLPVIIYEPDLSGRLLNKLTEHRPNSIIFNVGHQKNVSIPAGTEFIYTATTIKNMNRIPLIVSSAGMVFSGDKQRMLQCAEKFVYVAAEVYNTANRNNIKVRPLASKTNN